MNPAAIQAAIQIANTARLSAQKATFGRPAKINDQVNDPVRIATLNAPRFEAKLAEGGEKFGHDLTVRLVKSEWPEFTTPHNFKKAKVEILLNATMTDGEWTGGTWAAFTVATVDNVDHGNEWKLQLNARL